MATLSILGHRWIHFLTKVVLLLAIISLLLLIWTNNQAGTSLQVVKQGEGNFADQRLNAQRPNNPLNPPNPGAAVVQERDGYNHEENGAAAIEPEINSNVNNSRVDNRLIQTPPAKNPPQTTYDPNAPGEMGRPFITPTNLTEEEQKLVSDGWEKNAFNQYASDRISVRRRLPDIRDPWCKAEGRFANDLPATSIIIIFHNEALSILLRSFHSAVERAPEHLITDVILVDDCSDIPDLHEPLETYMKNYPKVKIIRAKERVGLIRARLMGAAAAKGPVLTFLDSHVEATTGWLEPLLDMIKHNPTTAACPVSDIIDEDTFEYKLNNTGAMDQIGGFHWNLMFDWHPIPERERRKHQHLAEPIASPTMLGGQFSIDKAFFEKLGGYDPGFLIWGSEHLELSFKTWMCGGGVYILPCSRVGHMFRKRSPYKWPSGVDVVRRNNVRLAKVWLDDYAQYYFDGIGNDLGDYGDISDRITLRKSLSCKSFRWYLNEVYPELYNPDNDLVHGEIRNLGSGGNLCLDSAANQKEVNMPLGLQNCHGRGGYQFWSYSKRGEIRREDMCVDYADGSEPKIYPCHGSLGTQQWIYDDRTGLVRHGPSQKCLGVGSDNKLVAEPCDESRDTQHWKLGN